MNELLKNPVIQVNGTATIGPSVESANLCEIKESRVVTTSLRVAEIFGKEHKRVLQSIRELECSADFRKHNFVLTLKDRELHGSVARQDPYYLITRDGFMFLVMGFTGKTAAKFKEAYIRAFNEMEAKLRRRQEAEQLPQPSKPHYTMADMPRMVHEQLQRPDADVIVESYGRQRVVSTVTLAPYRARAQERLRERAPHVQAHAEARPAVHPPDAHRAQGQRQGLRERQRRYVLYHHRGLPRAVHPLRGNQRGGGQTCNGRVLQGQGQGMPRAAEGAAETRAEGAAETRSGDAAGAEPAANAGRHDAAFRHGYGGDDGC